MRAIFVLMRGSLVNASSDGANMFNTLDTSVVSIHPDLFCVYPAPPREKACSQKHGNVANVRSSRQGAKKLQLIKTLNL